MLLSLLPHPFDFFLAQFVRSCDPYALLLSSTQIFCSHVQYSVSINVKSNLYLRYASRSRRQSNQVKLAQNLIIIKHGPFSLANPYCNSCLAVCRGAENLAFFSGYCCVSVDQFCKYAP